MTPALRERILHSGGVMYLAIVIIILAFLVGQVLSSKYNVVYYYSELTSVSTFQLTINDRDAATVSIPKQIKGLQPEDKVRLTTTLPARLQDNILVQTVHTAMRLSVDGQQLYYFGAAGTYPTFEGEPPTQIGIVSLPTGEEQLHLELEYTIAPGNTSLEIPQIYTGDKSLLFNNLIERNAFALGLSFAQILAGLIIAVVGATMLKRIQESTSLIWLGVICFFTGLWTGCANDILIFLLPQPALLYNINHISWLVLPIPFVCFGLALLKPAKRLPLEITGVTLCALFLAAIIAYIAGILPLSVSTQSNFILTPLLIALFIGYIIWEKVIHNNPMANQLTISCAVIAVFWILDTVNTSMDYIQPDGLVFQIGLIPFVIQLSIVSWKHINTAFADAERSRVLSLEMAALNSSLEHQKQLYEKLSGDNTEVLRMRHDLRHQLRSLRGLVHADKNDEAVNYIDSISDNIPQITDMYLCENFVVNALCVHYLGIANASGIQTDVNLVVPKTVGDIADNDLSIIIGNLFENAIEACEHVEESKRFIKLTTRMDSKRFMLTVDNSFDGTIKVDNGTFYSRKRKGKGVGTASVKAIVAKYGGTIKFETAAADTFKVSLYLPLQA